MLATKPIQYLIFWLKIFIINLFIYYLLIWYIFLILNFLIIVFILYLEIVKKIKKHYIIIFNIIKFQNMEFLNFFYLLVLKYIISLITVYIDFLYYNKKNQFTLKKLIFFFFCWFFIFITKLKIMIVIILYKALKINFKSEKHFSLFIINYFEIFFISNFYAFNNWIILINYDRIMYIKVSNSLI